MRYEWCLVTEETVAVETIYAILLYYLLAHTKPVGANYALLLPVPDIEMFIVSIEFVCIYLCACALTYISERLLPSYSNLVHNVRNILVRGEETVVRARREEFVTASCLYLRCQDLRIHRFWHILSIGVEVGEIVTVEMRFKRIGSVVKVGAQILQGCKILYLAKRDRVAYSQRYCLLLFV